MNIAFLHQDFPGGGTEKVTINVAKILEQEDSKVYVFASRIHNDKLSSEIKNIEVIALPCKFDDIQNIPTLIKNIQENDIQVLVFPGGVYDIIPFADIIREKTNCKCIYMSHSKPFWEYISMKELAEAKSKRNFLKRLHWYLIRSHKFTLGIKKARVCKSYKECYDKADMFGVLCENYGREIAKAIGVKYENSKFRVLTNHIEPINQYVKPKRKEVYYIGRLYYNAKRVDRLLSVWSMIEDRHPDWTLNLLGDGDEEDKLRCMAEKMGLKRVNFLGFSNNPQQYYDRASIVCLTSTYEGWPMVQLEAQANGCATIAFDCSAGVREILSPSWENGVLVKPHDLKAYAKALSKLMGDTQLREKIAENGRCAVQRFSPENTLSQWRAILKELS